MLTEMRTMCLWCFLRHWTPQTRLAGACVQSCGGGLGSLRAADAVSAGTNHLKATPMTNKLVTQRCSPQNDIAAQHAERIG